jgi:Holliday junction resolvasome RuvABC ATP-dependent DNA helicase subunit
MHLQHTYVLTPEEAQKLERRVAKVFQPRTPINTEEFFAGRWNQMTTVADATSQPGMHVVIYGERGVGKTSLANVVRPVIRAFDHMGSSTPGREQTPKRIVIKTNANSTDCFSSIWEKLLEDLAWVDESQQVGFVPKTKGRLSLRDAFELPDLLRIDDVRKIVSKMSDGPVFIVDEFERATENDSGVSRDFTDLIKTFSDFAVDCTIILVGVSDTVDGLVADHASINRALVQVFLPRMEAKELRQILENAEKALSIKFSDEAANLIVYISQGLPHYTHLIGLHAVRISAVGMSAYVEESAVFAALKEAVKQAQQTVTEKYLKATHSAHKDAIYRQVLLACGLAAATSHDALGYFNPSSIVEPLRHILNKPVQIATFNSHLSEFGQDKRGKVLERIGQPRAYRFRFHDPLLVPYVFMDAITNGIVNSNKLSQLLGARF